MQARTFSPWRWQLLARRWLARFRRGTAGRHRDGGQSVIGKHAARRRDRAADGRRTHHSQGAHPHDAMRNRSARFSRQEHAEHRAQYQHRDRRICLRSGFRQRPHAGLADPRRASLRRRRTQPSRARRRSRPRPPLSASAAGQSPSFLARTARRSSITSASSRSITAPELSTINRPDFKVTGIELEYPAGHRSSVFDIRHRTPAMIYQPAGPERGRARPSHRQYRRVRRARVTQQQLSRHAMGAHRHRLKRRQPDHHAGNPAGNRHDRDTGREARSLICRCVGPARRRYGDAIDEHGPAPHRSKSVANAGARFPHTSYDRHIHGPTFC